MSPRPVCGRLQLMVQTITIPRVKFKVTLERDEKSFWVAECVSLPGCVTQGKTKAEALSNLREAIEGWLESMQAHPETWTRDSR